MIGVYLRASSVNGEAWNWRNSMPGPATVTKIKKRLWTMLKNEDTTDIIMPKNHVVSINTRVSQLSTFDKKLLDQGWCGSLKHCKPNGTIFFLGNWLALRRAQCALAPKVWNFYGGVGSSSQSPFTLWPKRCILLRGFQISSHIPNRVTYDPFLAQKTVENWKYTRFCQFSTFLGQRRVKCYPI